MECFGVDCINFTVFKAITFRFLYIATNGNVFGGLFIMPIDVSVNICQVDNEP